MYTQLIKYNFMRLGQGQGDTKAKLKTKFTYRFRRREEEFSTEIHSWFTKKVQTDES